MRRMKLSRLGAGTTLAIVAFMASLVSMQGACNTNGNEACGINGVKDGICQVGPTCPSDSAELVISDPSDSCPASNGAGGESYICCVSNADGGADAPTVTPVADAGKNPG
jgi:hypothetical protein